MRLAYASRMCATHLRFAHARTNELERTNSDALNSQPTCRFSRRARREESSRFGACDANDLSPLPLPQPPRRRPPHPAVRPLRAPLAAAAVTADRLREAADRLDADEYQPPASVDWAVAALLRAVIGEDDGGYYIPVSIWDAALAVATAVLGPQP